MAVIARWFGLAMALAVALPSTGKAHDDQHHVARQSMPVVDRQPGGQQDKLPIEVDFGAALPLIDHTGRERDADSFAGKPVLLFFGYAHCEGICLAALPLMAEATELLAGRNIEVQPVMITIDPGRDTIDTLASNLHRYHGQFVGLTGSEHDLKRARKAFNITATVVFEQENGSVYKHGTFVYLLDGRGELLTVTPPILSGGALADIVENNIRFSEGS
jgi:protein SCO1/2